MRSVQLSARTDGDQIVLFDAPSDADAGAMVGRIVRVRVHEAVGLSLFGSPEHEPSRV